MLDVIILSNANTPQLQAMAQNTISSLRASTLVDINLVVVEQADIDWPGATVIRPQEEFNYNRFANLGARLGNSPWICIANNDLVFHPGWFETLLEIGHPVMSPRCPNDRRQQDVVGFELGDKVGRNLSGWCFVIRRDLWKRIGGFDEDFSFWCADNSLVEQLKAVDILPGVCADSTVVHLGSQTLKSVPDRSKLTVDQLRKFNRKFNKNLFAWGL